MAQHADTSSTPRTKRTGSRLFWFLQTAVWLFIMWLALDGSDTLWLGAVFSLAGAAAGVWLVPTEFYPWRPLQLVTFFLYFVGESFRGGVDVAWRAMAPSLPIEPEFIEVQLKLQPGLPRTVMVAVISLLPGTLSVALENDGRLTVHALTPRAAANLPKLEQRVQRLFAGGGKP